MKEAFIKRIISNQYTIIDADGKERIAHARGKLRYVRVSDKSSFNRRETKRTKRETRFITISPKVGDYVTYEERDGQVLIFEIKPRKNELDRPDVANVDAALLVFSAVNPDFSFRLLDRFLVILSLNRIEPIIVISKIDLIETKELIELERDLSYYRERLGYGIHFVDSKHRIGIEGLDPVFKDRVIVVAGQTGVGKSTLVNALIPGLDLRTQAISKALGRGKHTTRHTELYPYKGGYVVDTPGFSKIDLRIFEAPSLKDAYPDFISYADACKFKGKCLHVHEPGCAVKKAVEEGLIPRTRYAHYLSFYQEIEDMKDKY
ncbi:MAG: ribosome small subunit-dependent GTPase A [Acholeplasmataceae bacterium]